MLNFSRPRPKPGDPPAKRLLICEDDTLTAMSFALSLSDAGYEIVGPVRSAEDALAEAYQQLPDLALVDIGLSGAIDGISVAAELAPLGVPVIILTGNYQRAAEEGRAFAVDILVKPFSTEELKRTVAAVLKERETVGRD